MVDFKGQSDSPLRDAMRDVAEGRREAAPSLRAPSPARVAAACDCVRSEDVLSPLRKPGTFTRPLLRVAACLALLLGVAALMRPARPASKQELARLAAPALPAVATFADLADLMQNQELATCLTSEADNLSADLVDLTDTLNARTLEILF